MLANAATRCRAAKAFDKKKGKKMKLHTAARASVDPVTSAVIRARQLTGGKLLHGQTPKSGLERDIQ
eukprot:6938382-Lingulodinium_polyedra.AAC.1